MQLESLHARCKSYSKTKPLKKVTLLTYGPFEKKSSFSQEELNVHFENKNKFLTVTRLERVIDNLFNQWLNDKWRKHF